jgi:drug/metabolite transporter (DMT)-like permease
MTPLTALWASILIGAAGQIALKRAVTPRPGAAAAAGINGYVALLGSGWLWLYAACFGSATVLWLLALSGLAISYAFPLLSVGYVLVAVLARLFLAESVPPRRWLGIAIISFGVVLIARS